MRQSFGNLEAILERVPPQPDQLIGALQQVQAEFDYIPTEVLEAVCDHVGVPCSQGWAVVTFYKAFRLDPKAEHDINVCIGTACHVRGAVNLYEKFRRELAIKDEEGITSDQMFSLGKVRCLGCCSMGPVARVDEEIYGDLDQKKAENLVKRLKDEVQQ